MTQFTEQSKKSNVDVPPLVRMLGGLEGPTGDNQSLFKTILSLKKNERASFHIPGHKGNFDFYSWQSNSIVSAFQLDVTELSGLDDLTYPNSCIKAIEEEMAKVYGVSNSFISLGGASHGLMAAVISLAEPGKFLLVPRNIHRSVINAVVISGSELAWYEPEWDGDWGVWGPVNLEALKDQIGQSDMGNCAGIVVVSPTYAGALSDIGAVAKLAHRYGVPLVVDQAHGAHFLPGTKLPTSASAHGADLVALSLHKTLPGLTQTGLVNVSEGSIVAADRVKSNMRLLSSSSPSYPLMASIEMLARMACLEEFKKYLNSLGALCLSQTAKLEKSSGIQVYKCGAGTDPLHILIKVDCLSSGQLCQFFESKGVFVESKLGSGSLILAGLGTTVQDFELLHEVLAALPVSKNDKGFDSGEHRPAQFEQVMNPREAYFSDSELVGLENAEGRIAAECVSPCPPGVPVISPGAIVSGGLKSSESVIERVRVVKK